MEGEEAFIGSETKTVKKRGKKVKEPVLYANVFGLFLQVCLRQQNVNVGF